MDFEIWTFLKFFFSVLFLCICAFVMLLYMHKIFGFAVQTFVRCFLLPSTARVHIGGLFVSPLNCRVFIQNFLYQDENMSVRITDGYASFVFWDSWWKDASWTFVRDFMMSDDLKGMHCRVNVKLQWVHGVIVDVLKEQQKLLVQVEDNSSSEDSVQHINVVVDEISANASVTDMNGVDNNTNNDNNNDINCENWSADGFFGFPGGPLRAPSSPSRMGSFFSLPEGNDIIEQPNPAADDVREGQTKLFDMGMVQIEKKRGKFRVHLNGVGICLYNATYNYKDAVHEVAPAYERPSHKNSSRGRALSGIINRLLSSTNDLSRHQEQGQEMHQGWEYRMPSATINESAGTGTKRYSDEELKEAVEEQRRIKESRSLMQCFYNFIEAVEMEFYASYIDIGGAGASHPYFLHIGFKRAEGRVYLTQDGVPSVDLYRFVTEITAEELQARWCPMKKEKESSEVVAQPKCENRWRKSFLMMVNGSSPNEMPTPMTDEVSSLIRNYGMLLDGKEKSSVHIVFYRDVTNVYAGEDVSRQADLPRSGVEVLIDAPELCYGPWSHYSLMELKEYFYPTRYRPLEPLQFELNKRRPLAGFEVFVEFLRDTCVTMAFKRKTPAPSPPFGILDSGRNGVVLLTLGSGSQYIQKPQFLLREETKQQYESLFTGKNVWLATNGIQDSSAVLAHANTMELFIDRLDDRVYNRWKLWNVLTSLGETEVWWYMDYVPFFMDFIANWQFVPHLYHGEPLCTEEYNTYTRFVKEFIPNVKQLEFFLTGPLTLHLNANSQNVVFSDDINDKDVNTFLTFRVNGKGHFFMTLPNDTYTLSASTEVQRPFEVELSEIKAFINLPPTHPLYQSVDTTACFAWMDTISIHGSYSVQIPNQTKKQDRCPIVPETGRTKLRNYLNLDIQLRGLRGFVMTPHICTLMDTIRNLFGGSTYVVRPNELFWPLSRIQPKLNVPRNVRQKFDEYLQKDEPCSNNQEISLTLDILDMDVTLMVDEIAPPKINLCCGKLNFSFIRHPGVNDWTLILTPVAGRFLNQERNSILNKSFLCCGGVTMGVVQHFGPLPLRPLFHSATDISVDGISFDVTVEEVAMLTRFFTVFMEQFVARDTVLLQEIEKARMAAVFSAENISARTSLFRTEDRRATTTFDGTLPMSNRCNNSTSQGLPPNKPIDATVVRGVLQCYLRRVGMFMAQMPFSELVPDVVAASFQEYLEAFAQAEDMAKDYAIVTMLVSVQRVVGCVAVGTDSYLELQLPHGVQLATTTFNDLNSNNRMSIAVRRVVLRGFCRQTDANDHAKRDEDYLEVFHMETALRVRQCTAYPLDKGLESHWEKQQRFVDTNDVDRLFACSCEDEAQTPVFVDSVTGKSAAAQNRAWDTATHTPAPSRPVVQRGQQEQQTEKKVKQNREVSQFPVSQFERQISLLQERSGRMSASGVLISSTHTDLHTLHSFSHLRASALSNTTSDGVTLINDTNLRSERSADATVITTSTSKGAESDTNIEDTSHQFATCLSATETEYGNADYDEEEEDEEDNILDKEGKIGQMQRKKNCNDDYNDDDDDDDDDDDLCDSGGVSGLAVELFPGGGRSGNDVIWESERRRSKDPNNSDGTGANSVRPVEDLNSFLRPFFMQFSAEGDDTLLKYSSTAFTATPSIVRDRTRFHAPIPSTIFFAAMQPHQAPQFCMTQKTMDTAYNYENDDYYYDDARSESCGDSGGANVWTMRSADNRGRSREGATSKHLHLETVAPLEVLVTTKFLQNICLNAETRFLSTISEYHCYPPCATVSKAFDGGVLFTACDSDGMAVANEMSRVGGSAPRKSHRRKLVRNEPSKNRMHQKRWLSEFKIVSVFLPCMEMKFLADLLVPPENLPPNTEGKGVYTTTVCARSIQFVMQRTMPPGHAAMEVERTKTLGSASVSTFALITQVEYEPLVRNGNIRIKVPGIAYDEEKDTLAVSYITSLRGRGRHETMQGMESGTCRLTADTIAFHLTRDFFHYAHSVNALLQKLHSARVSFGQERQKEYEQQQRREVCVSGAESGPARQKSRESVRDPSSVAAQKMPELPFAPQETYIRANHIVQGVGSIKRLRIELIDVFREGRYICVHTERANVIDVCNPSAKFSASIPTGKSYSAHRMMPSDLSFLFPQQSVSVNASRPNNKGDTDANNLSKRFYYNNQKQQQKRRDAQVQLIGEVESIIVKLYPSVLRIINAINGKRVVMTSSPAEAARQDQKQIILSPTQFPYMYLESSTTAGNIFGFGVVFNGSFTFHELDVSMLYSDMNFLQFKGTNLTGHGDSRTDRVSSRECVRTHVLTEAISERLRKRLRAWVLRARARASRSRYVAAPSVTPQLHLRMNAFFFAESIFLQYVADAILASVAGRDKTGPLEEGGTREESRVIVASAKHVAVGVQQTDQNRLGGSSVSTAVAKDKSEQDLKNVWADGVQVNVQVKIDNVTVLSPYRLQAKETVLPQLHQWLCGWLGSRDLVRVMRATQPAPADESSSLLLPPKKNYAWFYVVYVHTVEFRSDLPQDVTVELKIPLVSAFLNTSSDQRLSLKAHLHPFMLLSKSPATGRHAVELPNVYFIYAKDDVKRAGACLMETIEITLSPNIISHMFLMFDRFLSVYAIFTGPFDLDGASKDNQSAQPQPPHQRHLQQQGPPIPLPSWQQGHFVFLMEGLRVSHLTSMTNMRFSLRRLRVVADVPGYGEPRPAHIVANVINAQVALVDRDDHDQMQASMRQVTQLARSEISTPSTKVAFIHQTPTVSGSEDLVRAVRPIGGFIWGLFETSFQLSTGRQSTNELRDALENIAMASPGSPLDLREIGKVGSTTTCWNLSVFSPLVIARVGLVPLLQRSIDETKEFAEKMKYAAQREGRLFRRELFKSAAYRPLARVRKQMDALMRQLQMQRTKRLMELVAQVAQTGSAPFQRQSSLGSSAEIGQQMQSSPLLSLLSSLVTTEVDLFNVTSAHTFCATISNLLVVIPFGDAAYRSILEEMPDVYLNGRGGRTLNRKRFIPTMAMKLKVENTFFACRLFRTQRCAPAIQNKMTLRNERFPSFSIAGEQNPAAPTLKLTARFVLDDIYLYSSDGSQLANGTSAKSLLESTNVLGGLGTLTSFDREEYHNSLSKIFLSTVEMPLYLSKSRNETTIRATMDLSAPKVSISTQFVSVLSQIAREIPSQPFRSLFHGHTMGYVSVSTKGRVSPSSSVMPASPATLPELTSGESRIPRHADPTKPSTVVLETKKGPMVFLIDLTARLEGGVMHVYSVQKDASHGADTAVHSLSDMKNQVPRSNRRRVKFAVSQMSQGEKASSNAATSAANAAASGSPMTVLLTIPIPEVAGMAVASIGGDPGEHGEIIVRLEMRAKTIEIGPSIISLAQEIQEWESVDEDGNSKRWTTMLELVKEWERDITNQTLSLYTSIADALLPLPRAFAKTLAQLRSTSNAISKQHRHHPEGYVQNQQTIPSERWHPTHFGVRSTDTATETKFISVQIHLKGLRFVLTTEPASSVSLSVFFDERDGSADFFLKRMIGQFPWQMHQGGSAFIPTVVSFIFCIRRVRVECQARMDVKSLGIYVPEVEVCVALRRYHQKWSLTSVYVHVPTDVSGVGVLDVILRAPHMSQLFTVQEIWHKELCELFRSIRTMFARGASIIKKNVTKSHTTNHHTPVELKNQISESVIFVFTISQGKMRLDLGSGDAQQASLDSANFVLKVEHCPGRLTRKLCFDVAVRGIMLRSEGVLTGVGKLETAFIKGFSIQNAPGNEVYVRSSSGRTFRHVICAHGLHAVFKERQLNDVFECRVAELHMSAMDGIGEENIATVRADVFLKRGDVVITPNTAPAFLNTMTRYSKIVAAQRETAVTRLSDAVVVMQRPRFFSCTTDEGNALLQEAIECGPDDSKCITAKSGEKSAIILPFMGNALTHIPCGEIRIRLEQTTVLLRSTSGEASNGASSLVASFPLATLSFAECPSEEHTVVKRVLQLDAKNIELFRSDAVKALIFGFRGPNRFDFFTQQRIGDSEIAFLLSLHQANPWTGNPRFQDFQQMIQLMRSFTKESNAEVLHHFGELEHLWSETPATRSSLKLASSAGSCGRTADAGVKGAIEDDHDNVDCTGSSNTGGGERCVDERHLKALPNTQFAPQMRFGGDVSVNIDVIFNWFGISKKMLPHVLHVKLCDKLEALLSRLDNRAGNSVSSSKAT